jgi:hypothetical protein
MKTLITSINETLNAKAIKETAVAVGNKYKVAVAFSGWRNYIVLANSEEEAKTKFENDEIDSVEDENETIGDILYVEPFDEETEAWEAEKHDEEEEAHDEELRSNRDREEYFKRYNSK